MIRAYILILTAMTLLCGCAYRLSPPADLHEEIRVEIGVNEARLVRSQSDMQAAVASAIQYQLGWKVSPTGSASLQLTLNREDIQTVGTVQGDLPAVWNITIRGQAIFHSRHGTYRTSFTGTGSSTGTNDEPAALVAASQAAALTLSAWLDGISYQWPKDPADKADKADKK